jgi:hypothetical protein
MRDDRRDSIDFHKRPESQRTAWHDRPRRTMIAEKLFAALIDERPVLDVASVNRDPDQGSAARTYTRKHLFQRVETMTHLCMERARRSSRGGPRVAEYPAYVRHSLMDHGVRIVTMGRRQPRKDDRHGTVRTNSHLSRPLAAAPRNRPRQLPRR